MYWGTAVEFRDRQKFPRHAKAWGAEHNGPGIRFICDSDAIDDPDNKGFWTTLALFRRLRRSLVWRGKLVCRRARRPDRDPNRRGSLNSNRHPRASVPLREIWHARGWRWRWGCRRLSSRRFTRFYLYSQFAARPALSFTFTFSKLCCTAL